MSEITFVSTPLRLPRKLGKAQRNDVATPAKAAGERSSSIRLAELAWFGGLYVASCTAFLVVSRGTHALLNLL